MPKISSALIAVSLAALVGRSGTADDTNYVEPQCPKALVELKSGKYVLSADSILLVIRELFARDWPMAPSAIKERDVEFRQVTQKVLQMEFGAAEFISKAQFRFKSWRAAVETVGEYKGKYTNWEKIDWKAILQSMHLAGLDVNLSALKRSAKVELETRLRAAGSQADAASFVDAMLARHENQWALVLKDAKIKLSAAKKPLPTFQLSPDEIVRALHLLHRKFSEVSVNHILLGKSDIILRMTETEFERPFSGRFLYHEILRQFDDFQAALEYAGYCTAILHRRNAPSFDFTRRDVSRILQTLREEGVDLHPTKFLLAPHQVTQALEKRLCQSLRAIDVWMLTEEFYGSWRTALQEEFPTDPILSNIKAGDHQSTSSRQPLANTCLRQVNKRHKLVVFKTALERLQLPTLYPEMHKVFWQWLEHHTRKFDIADLRRIVQKTNLSAIAKDRDIAIVVVERLAKTLDAESECD